MEVSSTFNVEVYSLLLTATTSGTAQALYTCPLNTIAEVTLLMCSNNSNSNRDINGLFYHAADGETHGFFIGQRILANSAIYPLDGQTLFLKPSDQLKFYASASDVIDVTICVKQYIKRMAL